MRWKQTSSESSPQCDRDFLTRVRVQESNPTESLPQDRTTLESIPAVSVSNTVSVSASGKRKRRVRRVPRTTKESIPESGEPPGSIQEPNRVEAALCEIIGLETAWLEQHNLSEINIEQQRYWKDPRVSQQLA
jgi:hypothetical protein